MESTSVSDTILIQLLALCTCIDVSLFMESTLGASHSAGYIEGSRGVKTGYLDVPLPVYILYLADICTYLEGNQMMLQPAGAVNSHHIVCCANNNWTSRVIFSGAEYFDCLEYFASPLSTYVVLYYICVKCT